MKVHDGGPDLVGGVFSETVIVQLRFKEWGGLAGDKQGNGREPQREETAFFTRVVKERQIWFYQGWSRTSILDYDKNFGWFPYTWKVNPFSLNTYFLE